MEFKKPTILVVDDMTTTLLLLHDLLKDTYEVKIAKSGTKALEILESPNDIDLILLDIEMPDINGYDVCKRIKNNETIRNIPIIFITGRTSQEDEEYGLNLGAIDYITKPFNKAIVKLRIKNYLNLKIKNDMLEKLSMYDGLTNIRNRRFFDETFEKTFSEIKRDKKSLAVLMIDIDFFKPYNDNYGHGQGDETLRKVAKALEKTIKRASDFVARYGGEEFVILLKNIDKTGLQTVAKNLLEAIRELKITHEYSKVEDFVTVSIGVSYCSCPDEITKTELLLKADEALYNVKNSGRNNFAILEV
ncbi:GGDEF domain-containing response regulator [Aliarcobacter butzleri]|uniref:GGDEF domain-containing response regulator n=2 Tax=Aliarcobacter butzleri TaxID=28197 RepID=UPI00125ED0E2|nr:diguanylate cyclase [Aliarcobacter butzleri]MCT7553310.1 diguanylate cyclase [Aliarcobacter butzleri]MCT7602505.1 diguanylate cyclase [Aliarcobacter butzleri]MCT7609126.1 diguanylate cyclase [Aliarcobacter butzleri]MCT7639691.1 diguanylate cyclase [Aliarcobacter butzleri]MDN5089922.1 diguanylate cyclase [Aliarcobacter butzleri]